MTLALVQIAAIPVGLAAVFFAVLWAGGVWDRAASAAAGFADALEPPYTPWQSDQPGHTLTHAVDKPDCLDDHPTKETT